MNEMTLEEAKLKQEWLSDNGYGSAITPLPDGSYKVSITQFPLTLEE